MLNVGNAGDALRQADCRHNLWHLVPSERMAAGDYSVRVSGSKGSDEFGRLAASFNAMAEAVGQAEESWWSDGLANV